MKTFILVLVCTTSLIVGILFQNCSNVRLSPIPNEAAETCELPEDINQYSIALYNQTPTSSSFQIVDSNGAATQIAADWNDGADRGNTVIFQENFSATAACVTTTIRASFSLCSQNFTLQQEVTLGPNCAQVVPSPTITPPPVTSCPAGMYSRGQVEYYGCGSTLGCPRTLNNINLTSYNDVWGRSTGAEPNLMPWPGDAVSQKFILYVPRTQYVAEKFHVPSSGSGYGWYTVPEFFGNAIDIAISTSCGDFNPSDASCKALNVSAGAGQVKWIHNLNYIGCHLNSNTDYYLNVRIADPNNSGPACNNNGCNLSMIMNLNYTP
jgi:hypothetical protein